MKKDRIEGACVFAQECPRVGSDVGNRHLLPGRNPASLIQRVLADVDANHVTRDLFLDDRSLETACSAPDTETWADHCAEAPVKGSDRPEVRISGDALIDRTTHERMCHPDLLVIRMMAEVLPIAHEVMTRFF